MSEETQKPEEHKENDAPQQSEATPAAAETADAPQEDVIAEANTAPEADQALAPAPVVRRNRCEHAW